MLRVSALVIALVSVGLSGCGGGSASVAGSGGSTPPPPTTPAADFSLSVTPVSGAMTAGSLSQTFVLSVSGSNDFGGAVAVSVSMPSGFSCASANCSGQVYSGASLSIQLFAAGTVTAGSYNITFTGTTATLSHSTSLSVTVAAAPVTLPNRSAQVFTDDFISPGWSAAYDKIHDHIFASNLQLSEVEVISPETLQITHTIYVPSPTGMDLSTDGSTLYVGTNTQNLFEISTATLQVQARVPFSGDLGFSFIFPTQVVALADGTIGILSTCGTINGCTSGSGFFILNPKTGAVFSPLLEIEPGALYANPLTPSADRTKLFMASPIGFTGANNFLEYDTATGSLTGLNIAGGAIGTLVARPDGNGYALAVNINGNGPGSEQVLFLTSTFQVAATWVNSGSGAFDGLPIYSVDSSRLYVPEAVPNYYADVFDANAYQHLGQIPTQGQNSFVAVDGENRLLSPNGGVLALVDGGATPGTIPSMPEGLGFTNEILSPDNWASGYSTTLNGGTFVAAPQIAFSGTQATDVQVDASNKISLTVPQIEGLAQAELTAVFPDGTALVEPDAYSFQPTILYTDQDGSAQNGGTTLEMCGFGLDFGASQLGVTIGGKAASNVSSHWIGISPYPAPVYCITATVPAGIQSNADIKITTPIGDASIPGGFAYVKRSDFDLPSTAAPFQMILDKSRNRLLWTDTTSNQLVVYSLTSGEIEQTVAIGNTPAGLSLTPDGSDVLVVDYGDAKLDIYDADSLTLIQQVSTPVPSEGVSPVPVWISAVANGKAFLLYTENGYSSMPVYEYDIPSNTFTQRNDVGADEGSFSAASADGSTAFVAGGIWSSSTDRFVPAILSEDYSRALSADGYAISEYRVVYGGSGTINGIAGMRMQIQSEMDFNSVPGQKLNATGSLSYFPENNRIRIVDVRHGQLVQTIMLPDGLSEEAVDGMAVDPDGQTIYVLTQTGVTTLQLASDPLSIGEVHASGNELTILGSGFGNEANVTVDGSVAAVTVDSSQEIVASVSSLSAGPHQIVVTLPTGASYTLDNALDTSTASGGKIAAARGRQSSAHRFSTAVPPKAMKRTLWQRLHSVPLSGR